MAQLGFQSLTDFRSCCALQYLHNNACTWEEGFHAHAVSFSALYTLNLLHKSYISRLLLIFNHLPIHELRHKSFPNDFILSTCGLSEYEYHRDAISDYSSDQVPFHRLSGCRAELSLIYGGEYKVLWPFTHCASQCLPERVFATRIWHVRERTYRFNVL